MPGCTGGRSRRTCARGRRCTSTCPARIAASSTRGAARLEGGHPVRGAARCADVLVRGLPERDGGYGVEGFTEDHARRSERTGVRRCSSPTTGTRRARGRRRARSRSLARSGSSCFRVQFPHGMDANEYAQKVKPAAKASRCGARSGVDGQGRVDDARVARRADSRSTSTGDRRREPTTAMPSPEPSRRAASRGCPTSTVESVGGDEHPSRAVADLFATRPDADSWRRPTSPARRLRRACARPHAGGRLVERRSDELVLRFGDRSVAGARAPAKNTHVTSSSV